jgi:uncharacterized OB-fold protein
MKRVTNTFQEREITGVYSRQSGLCHVPARATARNCNKAL